ncbi:hypothetical protein AFLA_003609 [Aspergillus flavus NRRL3357]|nr:hypothetical protein AFLA_003609 [Aspergillus flavus NRRL3357]
MKFFAITVASLASISGAFASANGGNDACSKYIYNTLYNDASVDVYHWREVIDKTNPNPCKSASGSCGADLYGIFKLDQNQDFYNWGQDMHLLLFKYSTKLIYPSLSSLLDTLALSLQNRAPDNWFGGRGRKMGGCLLKALYTIDRVGLSQLVITRK